MGAKDADSAAMAAEKPVHQVDLDPFFISKYEMTRAQWVRLTGNDPTVYGDQLPATCPVENVNQSEALEWLARLGLLLPSEAQWEFSARGGRTTPYWCGEDPESVRGAENIADSSWQRQAEASGVAEHPTARWDDRHAAYAPVASFRPNPFGLYDVGGNVAEWCACSFAFYGGSVEPGTGRRLGGDGRVVVRGGHYSEHPVFSRSSYRNKFPPDHRDHYIGVRPARMLEP